MIQCRDAVEHELTKAVPKTILKENESLKGYNRKRLSEFYDGPSTSKKTTHSPNFDTVTWDKRKVIDDLHQADTKGKNKLVMLRKRTWRTRDKWRTDCQRICHTKQY